MDYIWVAFDTFTLKGPSVTFLPPNAAHLSDDPQAPLGSIRGREDHDLQHRLFLQTMRLLSCKQSCSIYMKKQGKHMDR